MTHRFYKLKPLFERHFYEPCKSAFAIEVEVDEYGLMCRELSSNPHIMSLIQDRHNMIVPFSLLDWNRVSANPDAIELIQQNASKINWDELSKNSNAIELLLANPDKINWRNLSENTNPKAIDLLRKNPEKIEWNRLSRNINAIELLRDNPTKVDWNLLHSNQNPEIVGILLAYPELIDWDNEFPTTTLNDIGFLEQNLDKINWGYLSANPNAIELLKKHPDKIDWESLSENPNAIELLNQNPEKINLDFLLWNKNLVGLIELRPDLLETLYGIDGDLQIFNIWNDPNIFEFDYKAFARHMHYDTGLYEELYKNLLHPKNVPRFSGWGFEGFEDNLYTDLNI